MNHEFTYFYAHSSEPQTGSIARIPYGVCLEMSAGEDVYYVSSVFAQNGRGAIRVVHNSVDNFDIPTQQFDFNYLDGHREEHAALASVAEFICNRLAPESKASVYKALVAHASSENIL